MEKRNKIIHWTIATAIWIITLLVLLKSDLPINIDKLTLFFLTNFPHTIYPIYGSMLLVLCTWVIPILIFSFLHYTVLTKLFDIQFTFNDLRATRIPRSLLIAVFYAIMAGITGAVYALLLIMLRYDILGITNIKQVLILLKLDYPVIIDAMVTTFTLIIFSLFFFSKSVKETWKASIIAGIISGSTGYAVCEFLVWHFLAMK